MTNQRETINKPFVSPAPLQTAVLFLVFNRPDTTAQVFEAIRKARPPRLYVAADGARLDREGEIQKVATVRKIATAVDWPCVVRTLFRDENLGCKNAVSGAITWFFDSEEQGIILEDDCLPSQSFFWFCEELLIKYKEDQRVFHIDGCNFTKPFPIFEADYEFSNYALIWGWATWRRAWNMYDINITDLEKLKKFKRISHMFGSKQTESYWLKNLEQAKNFQIDTWAYRWFYSMWIQNGLSIRPSKNLIKNIGFGSDATHTKKTNAMYEQTIASEIGYPLIHPREMMANHVRDKECSETRFNLTALYPLRLYANMLKSIVRNFL